MGRERVSWDAGEVIQRAKPNVINKNIGPQDTVKRAYFLTYLKVAMKYFILILLLLSSSYVTVAQTVIEVDRYSENVYNPSEIYALAEDTLLIVELENKEAVVSLHDMSKKKVIASRRAGRGPGEFSQNGVKYITTFRDSLIWIWDEGQMKAVILDRKLNYISDVVADNGSISSAILKNKNTVVGRNFFSTESIVGLYELEDNRIQSNAIKTLTTTYFPTFAPIADNPLINQGPMTKGDDAVYIGFNYASSILVIDNDNSIDTLKNHPEYIPFPEYESRNGYEAPDHSKFSQATLDIAADEQHVYVLFSGKKFDIGFLGQVKKTITGEIVEEIEKSSNAKKVLVFDKNNKDFKYQFNLPVMAKRIAVIGNQLYALSYIDSIYEIIKYKIKL